MIFRARPQVDYHLTAALMSLNLKKKADKKALNIFYHAARLQPRSSSCTSALMGSDQMQNSLLARIFLSLELWSGCRPLTPPV